MCATECSAPCHARRDGRAMWVVYTGARFPATWPRVFCEPKIMKIVILIYQIIQEKFAYGELYMLVMIGYIFMFKMVKKMKNSGLENSSWVNTPLNALPAKSHHRPWGDWGVFTWNWVCTTSVLRIQAHLGLQSNSIIFSVHTSHIYCFQAKENSI